LIFTKNEKYIIRIFALFVILGSAVRLVEKYQPTFFSQMKENTREEQRKISPITNPKSLQDTIASNKKINLNLADELELVKLPKIGPKIAGLIVEYRTKHGRFQQIEDLVQIHGIGKKTIEAIRDAVILTEKEDKN